MARPQRKRVPRGTLTRAAVLRVALELLERDGVEAVTIRSVAAALGTKPMSLYTHIADKEDLLNGMFEVVLDEVDFPADDEGAWQDRFRLAGQRYRQAFLRHPTAIPMLHKRVRSSSSWLLMAEWSLATLVRAGFDIETAVQAYRSLATITLGSTLNEVWFHETEPGDLVLPIEDTPTLLAAAPYFAEPDFDAAYTFAIDTVIAGLERRLEERPGS